MTAILPQIPSTTSLVAASPVHRLHQKVQTELAPRTLLFLISTCVLFAMYVVLNWPHMGAHARLHWDAETCICTSDPMPTASQLAYNREHIYDIADEIHSRDPARVTAYFTNGKATAEHAPLEIVRRYYSQVSYALARCSFNLGARLSASPVGAMLFFQLAATACVSIAMGLLFTLAVVVTPPGSDLPKRLSILCLAFAAVASQIIFLSIARQVLTETVGLLFWVCSIVALVAALHPRRSSWQAFLLSAVTGALLFATVRTRYNLGPSVILIIPLVVLISVPVAELCWQWKRYLAQAATALAMFAVLVAVDARIYGPFFMPWVYNQTLVRSASLYFHSDPPYALFWVMIYNNFPLLLLPALGLSAGLLNASGIRRASGFTLPLWICSMVVFISLGILIALMGRQAVAYQGRHLFAFSAAAVITLFITIGRINWKTSQLLIFVPICLLVLTMNLHSTFGPQTLIPGQPGRPITRPSFSSRWQSRDHKLSLLVDLFNGYYEWADEARLHDPMVATTFISNQTGAPLVIIGGNNQASQRMEFLVNRFSNAKVVWIDRSPDHFKSLVESARAKGQPIYFYMEDKTAPFPGCRPANLQLDHSSLQYVGR